MLHGKSGILPEQATKLPQPRNKQVKSFIPSPISIKERRQVLLLSGDWLADALTDEEVEERTRRFIVPVDELNWFRDCLSREELPNREFFSWWGHWR